LTAAGREAMMAARCTPIDSGPARELGIRFPDEILVLVTEVSQ
jgi:hypothetical protein